MVSYLACSSPITSLCTQVGCLDDISITLSALFITDQTHFQLVQNRRDVCSIGCLAPAHRIQTGVSKLGLVISSWWQTCWFNVLCVAGQLAMWQPDQWHVIGNTVRVIVWMGNEGGGVDDFTSSFSVIQIVCTKVDIGTCGSEEMILLGINEKYFDYSWVQWAAVRTHSRFRRAPPQNHWELKDNPTIQGYLWGVTSDPPTILEVIFVSPQPGSPLNWTL